MGKYSDMAAGSAPAGGKYSSMAADAAPAPAKNKDKERGRALPSGVQGGMTAIQGPLFGFADELAGAASAGGQLLTGDTNIRDNYIATRDMYRGANDAAREQNPILMGVTGAMASAPLIVMSGGSSAVPAATATTARAGMGANMVRAGMTGLGYGGLSGAGESKADTFSGVLKDTAKGAAISGGMGAASVPIARGMGSAAGNIASRLSSTSADDYAQQKVAEALARDARGRIAQGSAPAAITQAEARLRQLGPDAAVVDAGGQNTRGLLDVLATAPGRTKDATERFIRLRQAGRGGRIADDAANALGTQGKAYVGSIEAFDQARQAAAKPYYDQLQNVMVNVDDDLLGLIRRSGSYHGEAEKLAKVSGLDGADFANIQPGGAVPLKMLDTLKQTLYDAADAAKRSGNRKMGAAIDDLRVSLIGKLDDVSPKDAQTGASVYKLARDAWSGPSSSITAAEAGRRAMKEDAISLAELTRGMSQSELEAFRIGATQAIREQAGTQGGQTKLLKMWMEPSTSGKLREIFGGNYKQFAAAIAKEGKKKGVETVGRGSQTASRLMGADDLDVSAVTDAVAAAGSAAKGNLPGLLSFAPNMLRRLQTPEPVRDRMGQILLTQGANGRSTLDALRQSAEQVAQERARRAAMAGAFSGVLRVEN
jgi:hypothetical protein